MLFQELEVFKNFCGLEINSSKTEGMWIGSLKREDENPFGIKWPSEPIKALGTFFTYDQSLLYEKNSSREGWQHKEADNYMVI